MRRLATHFVLAVSGLVVWIVYLGTGTRGVAWAAFAVLVLVGVVGASAFRIWQRRRLGFVKATHDDWNWPTEAMVSGEAIPAEQHFPASVVLLHGVLAIGTVVLVLLTAVGVGSGNENGTPAARSAAVVLGPPSTALRTNQVPGSNRRGQTYRSQLTLGGVFHVYTGGGRVFVANSAIVPSQEGGATRADVERLQRWALHMRREHAAGRSATPAAAVRAAARRFYSGS